MAGPQFIKYFPHVISALKDLGNSGTPPEVRELIAEKLKLSTDELNEQINSGASRFDNHVAWAKFYLAKAGYIDASKRGVWSLTEKGINANITDKEALKIFQGVQKQFKDKTPASEYNLTQAIEETIAPTDTSLTTSRDYRTELLEIIRSLSPAGFEKAEMGVLTVKDFCKLTSC
jgi:restriction system protein